MDTEHPFTSGPATHCSPSATQPNQDDNRAGPSSGVRIGPRGKPITTGADRKRKSRQNPEVYGKCLILPHTYLIHLAREVQRINERQKEKRRIAKEKRLEEKAEAERPEKERKAKAKAERTRIAREKREAKEAGKKKKKGPVRRQEWLEGRGLLPTSTSPPAIALQQASASTTMSISPISGTSQTANPATSPQPVSVCQRRDPHDIVREPGYDHTPNLSLASSFSEPSDAGMDIGTEGEEEEQEELEYDEDLMAYDALVDRVQRLDNRAVE